MSHRFSQLAGRAIVLGLTLAGAAAPVFAQSQADAPSIGMVLVHNASSNEAKGPAHRPMLHLRDQPPVFAAPAGTIAASHVTPGSIVRIGPPAKLSSIGIPSVDANPTDSVQPSKH